MGENEKEWRMKKGRILFVELGLVSETIPRIVESVNLIHPEGLSVKGIISQCKPNEEAEDKRDQFFSLQQSIFDPHGDVF